MIINLQIRLHHTAWKHVLRKPDSDTFRVGCIDAEPKSAKVDLLVFD